jgi:hypothetical protein
MKLAHGCILNAVHHHQLERKVIFSFFADNEYCNNAPRAVIQTHFLFKNVIYKDVFNICNYSS